jgi:hypothetical protein
MITHGRPSLVEARQRERGVMVVIKGGLGEVRTAVGRCANQWGLDPGVYSGSFPLWRGRPKPFIIVIATLAALRQTDDACSGETFCSVIPGSGRRPSVRNP